MLQIRGRIASRALLMIILPALLNVGCGSHEHRVSVTEYPLPCAVVREAELRCGPVDLPITAESRKQISTFLQRGGNWANHEVVDLSAPAHYQRLFDLLSDPTFLRSANFRDEETIHRVSAQLEPWFRNPIIYQLVDATQERPPVLAPICMNDGGYWWIFYPGRMLAGTGDLEITKLLVSAPLSSMIEQYPEMKDTAANAPGTDSVGRVPMQVFADAKQGPNNPQDMHAALLRQLMKVSRVRLVARLKDERLGYPAVHGVRVFIPDVHLLSKDRAKEFRYATNHVDMLTDVAGELVTFKQSATSMGVPVTVYQLGDFVDLWRQFPKYRKFEEAAEEGQMNYQKVLEDHSTLSQRLFGPELGTRRVLGNHDFNTHYAATCIGAELLYCFPYDAGSHLVAVTLHGDRFDPFQRRVSSRLQHRATYRFGPMVQQAVYDLVGVPGKLIESLGKESYGDHVLLASPEASEESGHSQEEMARLEESLTQSRFNVKTAGTSNVPEPLFEFLPEAKRFTETINNQTGWDLRLVVVGHTHRARIVLDERSDTDGGTKRGFFALVDCGAWMEEGYLDGMVVPNAQIGVLYDDDVRIYQLSPKARIEARAPDDSRTPDG